jgi:hypothetical protein
VVDVTPLLLHVVAMRMEFHVIQVRTQYGVQDGLALVGDLPAGGFSSYQPLVATGVTLLPSSGSVIVSNCSCERIVTSKSASVS